MEFYASVVRARQNLTTFDATTISWSTSSLGSEKRATFWIFVLLNNQSQISIRVNARNMHPLMHADSPSQFLKQHSNIISTKQERQCLYYLLLTLFLFTASSYQATSFLMASLHIFLSYPALVWFEYSKWPTNCLVDKIRYVFHIFVWYMLHQLSFWLYIHTSVYPH